MYNCKVKKKDNSNGDNNNGKTKNHYYSAVRPTATNERHENNWYW